MNIHALHDRRARFLQSLGHLTATERYDAFMREVMETNGNLTTFHNEHRIPCLTAIHLHGVSRCGDTDEEAFANWTQAARAVDA